MAAATPGSERDIDQALQEAEAAASERAADFARQASRERKLAAAWHELLELYHRDWPRHVSRILGDRFTPGDPNVTEGEHELLRQMAEWATASRTPWSEFPRAMERCCLEAQVRLDGRTRHPRYVIADGYVWADVDEATGQARIANPIRQGPALPADAAAVAEALRSEYDRLFCRPFDSGQFLAALVASYDEAKPASGSSRADAMPVRTVLMPTAERLGLKLDQAVVDLSRLCREGPVDAAGRTMRLRHARASSLTVLLHRSDPPGHIGYIEFIEKDRE